MECLLENGGYAQRRFSLLFSLHGLRNNSFFALLEKLRVYAENQFILFVGCLIGEAKRDMSW